MTKNETKGEKVKLKYKYIHFVEYKRESIAYTMHNTKSGEAMGAVSYYPQWRQSVVEFVENCVFNNQCLKDIADFLEQLNRRSK